LGPEIDERITDEIESLLGFMRILLGNRNLTIYNPQLIQYGKIFG